MVKKYEVVIVDLNPIRGAEKRGVRPCIILQNNPVNKSKLQTVTLAPITKHVRAFRSMLSITSSKENGLDIDSAVDLSQIRTVDKSRIHKTIGHLEPKYYEDISEKISNFLDLRDEYL